jgi:hypothetical protein
MSNPTKTPVPTLKGCLPNKNLGVPYGDCVYNENDKAYKSKTYSGMNLNCLPPKGVEKIPEGCIQTSLTSASPAPTATKKSTPPKPTTTPLPMIKGCLSDPKNPMDIPKNGCVPDRSGNYTYGMYKCKKDTEKGVNPLCFKNKPTSAPSSNQGNNTKKSGTDQNFLNNYNAFSDQYGIAYNNSSLKISTPTVAVDQGISGCLRDSKSNVQRYDCEWDQSRQMYKSKSNMGAPCKDPKDADPLCFKNKPTSAPSSNSNRQTSNTSSQQSANKYLADYNAFSNEYGIESFGAMSKTKKTIVISVSVIGSLVLLILLLKIIKKMKKK